MHQNKNRMKALLIILLLSVMVVSVAGCSAKEEEPAAGDASSDVALQVVVCSMYVDDTRLEAFADDLRGALPQYAGESIVVSGVSMGDSESDPMGSMAGMTRVSAMLATGEIDLFVGDPGNAARYARSDTFVPLADLEGLDDYQGREITFHEVDDAGNETDTMLPPIGVDISGHETLAPVVGTEIGAYVVDMDTPRRAAAVEAMNALMEASK